MLLFVTVCLSSAYLSAATTNVILGPGNSFNPNSITVQVGDTVHWDNNTGSGGFHNVAPNGGSEPTANGVGTGWTYDYVFNNPGAFAYLCQVHGGGMSGVVNVAPAPTATFTETITVSPTPTQTATEVPAGSSPTDTPTISPTFSASPTFSESPTPSSTSTITVTRTPGTPPIQIFDKAPELLLAPNPSKLGDPVCLYSGFVPEESRWDVYNSGAQRVARLTFKGPGPQCWDTKPVVPGIYYVDVHWVLVDGRVKKVKQKVVLWR